MVSRVTGGQGAVAAAAAAEERGLESSERDRLRQRLRKAAWAQVGVPGATSPGHGCAMLPGVGTGWGKVCGVMGRAGRRGLGDALCRAQGVGQGGDCWWGEGWPRVEPRGDHTFTPGPGGGPRSLVGREAAGPRPGGRTHSDRRTQPASGPLFGDAPGKCSPAGAGWGAPRGAPRGLCELRGALSKAPAWLQVPPFRVGVCPSGGVCLRLAVSPGACVVFVGVFCLCISVHLPSV